mmetsp:Transcript_15145/g.46278  ORF Transcript_15145/g.46278 Transcript_15145/m.46278 type:complete len:209 (-) Transcript_15145:2236-2862(-)
MWPWSPWARTALASPRPWRRPRSSSSSRLALPTGSECSQKWTPSTPLCRLPVQRLQQAQEEAQAAGARAARGRATAAGAPRRMRGTSTRRCRTTGTGPRATRPRPPQPLSSGTPHSKRSAELCALQRARQARPPPRARASRGTRAQSRRRPRAQLPRRRARRTRTGTTEGPLRPLTGTRVQRVCTPWREQRGERSGRCGLRRGCGGGL